MSADGSVTLAWGDSEERKFRLSIAALIELQEKCKAGPPEILDRLLSGRWKVEDIRETLRLGLVGGGAKPEEALALRARYVDTRLQESALVAQAVLMAALVGVKDDPVGKREAVPDATGATVASPPPLSTEPAQP
jgi:Phage tail tube protein, GTA-gp10